MLVSIPVPGPALESTDSVRAGALLGAVRAVQGDEAVVLEAARVEDGRLAERALDRNVRARWNVALQRRVTPDFDIAQTVGRSVRGVNERGAVNDGPGCATRAG